MIHTIHKSLNDLKGFQYHYMLSPAGKEEYFEYICTEDNKKFTNSTTSYSYIWEDEDSLFGEYISILVGFDGSISIAQWDNIDGEYNKPFIKKSNFINKILAEDELAKKQGKVHLTVDREWGLIL